MTFLTFFKDICVSRPGIVAAISFLFLLAGVLELFSMAMVLPVLMGLFDSAQETGFAGEIIALMGLSDVSLTEGLIFIAILMSVRGLLLLLADFIMAGFARDLETEVRGAMFSSFIRAGWTYLMAQNLGRIPNLLLRETEKYSVAIQKFGQFLSSFLISGILIISSVFASWQLSVIFVCAVLPYLFLTRFLTKKIRLHAKQRIEEANELSAQVSENLMHLKYIKASALEGRVSERFLANVARYAHHFFKVMCHTRFIKNFPEVFGVLMLTALILLAHSFMALKPADIIFFLLLMFRGYRQISGVQTVLTSLIENIPSYEVCQRFICDANTHKEENDNGVALKADQVRISAKDVFFSYKKGGEQILKGVSVDIPQKGLVAFTGASGSGKTTLADLFLGLMVPDKGDILIGEGLSLRDVNLTQWREKVGYVSQDPFLVSGSIRENILLHADDQTDENLMRTAKLAAVDSFVKDLPDGYDTHIGLINTGLSGGQKQRIALARALAHDPLFLILDEATSALDAKTEKDIRKAIKAISKEKPVLMIAHSLEVIKEADVVYVLEKGEVVETGSYKALIKAKGALWRLQESLAS